MITVCIFLFSLFFGYLPQESNNNKHPIKVSIELPDTINYVGQRRNIPIILKFENTTSESLIIRNLTAHIKQGEKQIMDLPKMEGKAGSLELFISIKGHEIYRTKYFYTLGQLFNFERHPSENYDIYFYYSYKSMKKAFIKRIFSKKSPFIEEKCTISDVFTFYYVHKQDLPASFYRNLLNTIRDMD